MDGLGALDGSNEVANEAAAKALNSADDGVQRAAIALLPTTDVGSELMVSSGVLEARNLHVRLAAMLRASELPETDALFQKMESLSKDAQTNEDKWLSAASKIYFKEQNKESIDPSSVITVIPAADEQVSTWKYTEDQPDDNWTSPDFDDGHWKEGRGAFGDTDYKDFIRTEWSSDDLWLRKEIMMEEELGAPVLKIFHDDDYELYLNGQPLKAEKGWTPTYKYFRLGEDQAKLFKKGKNTLAVHVNNGSGGQHIDVGISKAGSFKADRVITLNAVPQKMAYDKTLVHAMAGENLEIVLNNTDQMQHNLVLIQEGSLEAFGKIVDKFLTSPDAAKLEYVPKSRYVLGATRMLDPEGKDVIQVSVPDKAGDYPFVCTFPGHWRMMNGILRVSAKGSYLATAENAPSIAVMGGGGSHEFLKYFGIADGKILHDNGANSVNYTENSAQLATWLETTDALVISNNKEFTATAKDAIFKRVNNGMPMLIYHPSTWYNWTNWPSYNRELVGGGSKSHEKLQEFEVIVKKPNHPLMKGVPKRFRIVDELYRWERDPKGTPVEVLAIGKGLESGDEFPVVWVVKHNKSKIVCNTLGHDDRAHNLPAYQTILKNSVRYILPKRAM